jgi:hypothetical protein
MMAETDLTIHDVKARAVLAPLKQPIRTAVGTIPAAPLVLLDMLTNEGIVGRSYIFGYTPAALLPLVRPWRPNFSRPGLQRSAMSERGSIWRTDSQDGFGRLVRP